MKCFLVFIDASVRQLSQEGSVLYNESFPNGCHCSQDDDDWRSLIVLIIRPLVDLQFGDADES